MLCECTGCALYFEADLLADDEELACPLCGEPATEMSDERDSGAGLGALAVDRPLDVEQRVDPFQRTARRLLGKQR